MDKTFRVNDLMKRPKAGRMNGNLALMSLSLLLMMGCSACSDSNRQTPNLDSPQNPEEPADDEEPFALKDRTSSSPHTDLTAIATTQQVLAMLKKR